MIYFVQDSVTLLIKIGYTGRDMDSRLRDFRTGNPRPLVVLMLMDGDKHTENSLHVRFAEARDAGEWFRPVPALLKFVCQKYEGRRQQVARMFACYGDDEDGQVIGCPQCDFEHSHILKSRSIVSGEDTSITFEGECGHFWELSIHHHKGVNYWKVSDVQEFDYARTT